MLQLTRFTLATIAALLLSPIALLPAQANTKSVTADGTTIGTDGDTWFLTSPVEDTTRSFDGGRLRVYDVHVAKMFEITHYQCNRTQVQSLTWFYRANEENMGRFRISCKLAQDLAIAYGTGQAEPTGIFMAEIPEPSYQQIPTFDIRGEKVAKWMRFTQNFKPLK